MCEKLKCKKISCFRWYKLNNINMVFLIQFYSYYFNPQYDHQQRVIHHNSWKHLGNELLLPNFKMRWNFQDEVFWTSCYSALWEFLPVTRCTPNHYSCCYQAKVFLLFFFFNWFRSLKFKPQNFGTEII